MTTTTTTAIELLVERRGAGLALLSPEVGLFTEARPAGDLLAPGADAGVLLALGRALRLVVPEGVEGRVTSAPPARTRQPVAWGDLLYEVEAATAAEPGRGRTPAGSARAADSAAGAGSGQLLVRSPQSGRFYLRPAPGEEPFVTAGASVEEGQPIGLIEVMKTFAHVRYTGPGLPPRARVARVLIEDGAEVAAGDPLLEVEAAPAGLSPASGAS